jgi:hypothetical protein
MGKTAGEKARALRSEEVDKAKWAFEQLDFHVVLDFDDCGEASIYGEDGRSQAAVNAWLGTDAQGNDLTFDEEPGTRHYGQPKLKRVRR